MQHPLLKNNERLNEKKNSERTWTILEILKWASPYFASRNIDTPRLDAEILLSHALQCKRIDLYLRYDQPLCKNELALFKSLIKRRISREPVAYIVGKKDFWSLELEITGDVLIPRPETECVVETAISLLPPDVPKRILEIGTGSGAIVLALASEQPGNVFFASDRSVKAVEIARKNAFRNNLGERVHFFAGDWFAPLRTDMPLFDMILSNPPYIRRGMIPQLAPEICKYEPSAALDGGPDGLAALRHIIRSAYSYLADGGHLLLEIGYDQKDAVQKIAAGCGYYEDISVIKDYGGHDRVVQMRKGK
ncbi:MAG: protein-(glutamine-N5) methyltransferase, release factor-specific [Desulfobacteraceae bacterium IS3]|nr:MAG: protein-(glutamine-N5) methyltransferase, release factor-specific [Desulfobacteraceae bacterium IS3]